MNIIWCEDEKYLAEMARFQVEMAKETEDFDLDLETVTRGIKTQIDRSQTGRYLLALDGDKLVGMLLSLNEWSDWRCQNVIWIHSVYVLPSYRGKKVFKTMYDKVKNEVQGNSDLAGIRLYVDKTNTKAQAVYKKIHMTDEHYSLFEWMK